MALEIVTLPTLSDNYNFLLHDTASGQSALVDAPEDGSIAEAIKDRGWGLDVILLTHHHWDHIDGAEALRSEFGAKIVGAAADATVFRRWIRWCLRVKALICSAMRCR